MEEREENRDSETLVEGEPEFGKPKLEGKILNMPKESTIAGSTAATGLLYWIQAIRIYRRAAQ